MTVQRYQKAKYCVIFAWWRLITRKRCTYIIFSIIVIIGWFLFDKVLCKVIDLIKSWSLHWLKVLTMSDSFCCCRCCCCCSKFGLGSGGVDFFCNCCCNKFVFGAMGCNVIFRFCDSKDANWFCLCCCCCCWSRRCCKMFACGLLPDIDSLFGMRPIHIRCFFCAASHRFLKLCHEFK